MGRLGYTEVCRPPLLAIDIVSPFYMLPLLQKQCYQILDTQKGQNCLKEPIFCAFGVLKYVVFVLPIPMAEKCDSNKTTMRAPKSTFFRAKSANVAQVQSLVALAPIVCLASLFMANSALSNPADPTFFPRENLKRVGRY